MKAGDEEGSPQCLMGIVKLAPMVELQWDRQTRDNIYEMRNVNVGPQGSLARIEVNMIIWF